KRLYCSLVCPLIPANAIVGTISPFRVRVDHDRCINCGLCVENCDVFAMSTGKSEKPIPTIECVRCGNCIDRCPKKAIDYTLLGTTAGVRPWFIALAVTFCMMLTYGFSMTIVQYLFTGTVTS
ncbi:MAG: 4Fe-4S binding protein, partial [Methanospirillum sp.]|uniref:4Fe-4S binding protein n=1 Tax=Methanospirillum sp. TaxID=45200 RepID=UPI00236B2032